MCALLVIAARVIERQAQMLSMHGIEPDPAAEETMNAIDGMAGPLDRCVCCDAPIPEGRQVCPICERKCRT